MEGNTLSDQEEAAGSVHFDLWKRPIGSVTIEKTATINSFCKDDMTDLGCLCCCDLLMF